MVARGKLSSKDLKKTLREFRQASVLIKKCFKKKKWSLLKKVDLGILVYYGYCGLYGDY